MKPQELLEVCRAALRRNVGLRQISLTSPDNRQPLPGFRGRRNRSYYGDGLDIFVYSEAQVRRIVKLCLDELEEQEASAEEESFEVGLRGCAGRTKRRGRERPCAQTAIVTSSDGKPYCYYHDPDNPRKFGEPYGGFRWRGPEEWD